MATAGWVDEIHSANSTDIGTGTMGLGIASGEWELLAVYQLGIASGFCQLMGIASGFHRNFDRS